MLRVAAICAVTLILAGCFNPNEPQGPRFSCPVVRAVAGLDQLPYTPASDGRPALAQLRIVDGICTYDEGTQTFTVTSTYAIVLDRSAGPEGVIIPLVIAIDTPTGMVVQQEIAAQIPPGQGGVQETFEQDVRGLGGPGGGGSTILFALQPDDAARNQIGDAVPRPAN